MMNRSKEELCNLISADKIVLILDCFDDAWLIILFSEKKDGKKLSRSSSEMCVLSFLFRGRWIKHYNSKLV